MRVCLALAAGQTVARGVHARADPGVARESRAVAGVWRVLLRSIGDLVVTQGAVESLTVVAEPQLMPRIVTRVREGTLVLDTTGEIHTQRELRFELTVRELRQLRAEGSGDISIAGLQGSALDILLAGSGGLHAKGMRLGRLALSLTGSGEVTLAGEAADQTMSIEGAGGVNARALTGDQVRVRITGSGSAAVRARVSLDVDISGSGDVTYYGSPRLRQSVSGSGSVTRG